MDIVEEEVSSSSVVADFDGVSYVQRRREKHEQIMKVALTHGVAACLGDGSDELGEQPLVKR